MGGFGLHGFKVPVIGFLHILAVAVSVKSPKARVKTAGIIKSALLMAFSLLFLDYSTVALASCPLGSA